MIIWYVIKFALILSLCLGAVMGLLFCIGLFAELIKKENWEDIE